MGHVFILNMIKKLRRLANRGYADSYFPIKVIIMRESQRILIGHAPIISFKNPPTHVYGRLLLDIGRPIWVVGLGTLGFMDRTHRHVRSRDRGAYVHPKLLKYSLQVE